MLESGRRPTPVRRVWPLAALLALAALGAAPGPVAAQELLLRQVSVSRSLVSTVAAAQVTIVVQNLSTTETGVISRLEPTFLANGVDVSNTYSIPPAQKGAFSLAPLEVQTRTFDVTVQQTTPRGFTVIRAAFQTVATVLRIDSVESSWTVQSAPQVSVVSVSPSQPKVSRGQKLTVRVTVRNGGDASAVLQSAELNFGVTSSADVFNSDYSVASLVDLPIGGNSSTNIDFDVTVGPTAPTGLAQLRLKGSLLEASSGVSIEPTSAFRNRPGSWIVQRPPDLRVLSIQPEKTFLSVGDTMVVTVTLANLGETDVVTQNVVLQTGREPSVAAESLGDLRPGDFLLAGRQRSIRFLLAHRPATVSGAVTLITSLTVTNANSGERFTLQSGNALILARANPVVTISPSQSSVRVGTPVALSGVVTERSEAVSFVYSWEKLSGPTITGPQGVETDRFTFTASAIGTLNFRLRVRDNLGGQAEAIAQVQVTDPFIDPGPFLRVRSIRAPAFVSQGQSTPVSVELENAGDQAADLTLGNTLEFQDRNQIGVSGDYSVTPAPANTVSLAAGTSTTMRYVVDISGSAQTGRVDLRSTLSGLKDHDFGPWYWVVQKPAEIEVLGFEPTLAQRRVSRGQRSSIDVVFPIRNSGEAAARITTVDLFIGPGGLIHPDFVFDEPPQFDSTLTAFGKGLVRMKLRVLPTAPTGPTTLAAFVTALDANSAKALFTQTAQEHREQLIIERPAELSIEGIQRSTSFISFLGDPVDITISVRSAGESAATSLLAQGQRAAEYTVDKIPRSSPVLPILRTENVRETPEEFPKEPFTEVARAGSGEVVQLHASYTLRDPLLSFEGGPMAEVLQVRFFDGNDRSPASELFSPPFSSGVFLLGNHDPGSVPKTTPESPVIGVDGKVRVTLDANTRDDDSDIIFHTWTPVQQPLLPTPTLTAPRARVTTFEASEPGLYEFELAVTDERGGRARPVDRRGVELPLGRVRVLVHRLPVLSATKDKTGTVETCTRVTLTGSSSIASGADRISLYRWEQLPVQGTPPIDLLPSSFEPVVTLQPTLPGSYSFKLTALTTGNLLAPDSAPITVTVVENTPPLISGLPTTLTTSIQDGVPARVQLAANAVDATDQAGLTFTWTQDSGPTAVTLTGRTSPTVAFEVPQVGAYAFSLRVEDHPGCSGVTTSVQVVAVANRQPVVTAQIQPGPIVFGSPVALTGTVSDPDQNDPVTTTWVLTQGFGGQAILDNPLSLTTTFTPPQAGFYAFRLHASDSRGGQAVSGEVGLSALDPGTPQNPPAVRLVDMAIPRPLISQGQSTRVTLSLVNDGNSAAVLNRRQLLLSRGTEDRTADYSVTEAPENSSVIPAGGSTRLEFLVTQQSTNAASLGLIRIRADLAEQLSTVGGLSLVTRDWTVQTPPLLRVRSVRLPRPTITQGQKGIPVDVEVANEGQAELLVSLAALDFANTRRSLATDYQVRGPTEAVSLLESTATTFSFLVDTQTFADTRNSPVTVRFRARAIDRNTGLSVAASRVDTSTGSTWSVQGKPRLSVALQAPSSSVLSASVTSLLTLTVTNEGEGANEAAAAVVDSVQIESRFGSVIATPVANPTGTTLEHNRSTTVTLRMSAGNFRFTSDRVSAVVFYHDANDPSTGYAPARSEELAFTLRPPPSISDFGATPQVVSAAESTSLRVSAQGAGPFTYQWSRVSGPADLVFGTPTARETSARATATGTAVVRIVVTDSAAESVQTTFSFRINAEPTAQFELPARTFTGAQLTLDARSSADPDGPVRSYQWSAQPALPIASSTAALTTLVAQSTGSYGIRLAVTDADGKQSSLERQLTVIDDQLPDAVASITPSGLLRSSDGLPVVVTLVGSASSDPDPGTVLTYEWRGPTEPIGATPSFPASAVTTVRLPAAGTFVFRLTVKDELGASSSADVSVTADFNSRPIPRVAVTPAGPTYISTDRAPVLVRLDASASSDPDLADLGSLTYAWSASVTPTTTLPIRILPDSAAPTVTLSMPAAGSYRVRLIVQDPGGASDSLERTLEVTANASPRSVISGNLTTPSVNGRAASLLLDGSSSADPDGEPIQYRWRVLSGSATPAATRTARAMFTLPAPGKADVELRVTDPRGAEAARQVTLESLINNGPSIEVHPRMPALEIPGAAAFALLLPGGAARTFELDASLTSTRFPPQNFSWSAIGGLSLQGAATAVVRTTLSQPGTYTFQLRARDAVGAEFSRSFDVLAQLDTDSDGMPDVFEIQSGFNPGDPTDAGGDADGDGVTNAREFLGGTSARNPDTDGDLARDGLDSSPLDPLLRRPRADAGKDRTVDPGLVVLDGSRSADPTGQPLSFSWRQTGGPETVSSPAAVATPSVVLRRATQPDQPYLFTLTVASTQTSTPSTVRIAVRDLPPVAVAGAPADLTAGSSVALDGAASYDLNGDSLQYSWSADGTNPAPGGLSGATESTPRFTSAVPGRYKFHLSVRANGRDATAAASQTVRVIEAQAKRLPPTANAGLDLVGRAGTAVQLDGHESFNPSGAKLAYAWSVARMPAAAAAGVGFQEASDPRPLVTFPAAGEYTLQLIVSEVGDSTRVSEPAFVRAFVQPSGTARLPRAVAGADRVVAAGSTVMMDARESSNGGTGALAYTWRQLSGPPVQVQTSSALWAWTAGLAAEHRFELTASGAGGVGPPDSVRVLVIDANTHPPLASARLRGISPTAGELRVTANSQSGTLFTLDGTASLDPDGDALIYRWQQIEGPLVALSAPDSAVTSFTAFTSRVYGFRLRVGDGDYVSETELFVVVDTELNQVPKAVIANLPATSISTGAVVVLDGSGSVDGNRQGLIFRWFQTAGPFVDIEQANQPVARVRVTALGQYAFALSVDDGNDRSMPARVTFDAVAGAALPPAVDPRTGGQGTAAADGGGGGGCGLGTRARGQVDLALLVALVSVGLAMRRRGSARLRRLGVERDRQPGDYGRR
ncbi:MAG: hypothetical protein HYY25_03495 [Candidatus Wallbacteria bacterium]|nr:hypothetical protein [Candidatus Wallbacteria bacterium]